MRYDQMEFSIEVLYRSALSITKAVDIVTQNLEVASCKHVRIKLTLWSILFDITHWVEQVLVFCEQSFRQPFIDAHVDSHLSLFVSMSTVYYHLKVNNIGSD